MSYMCEFLNVTHPRCRHSVCHHPATMAPNLAETRRRQGAPCRRGNMSGMQHPSRPKKRTHAKSQCFAEGKEHFMFRNYD